MNYFLAKADPENDYSIDDLARDGETIWDGVHNNAAILHIQKMTVGDRIFIYHSQSEKAVVGLAEVVGEPFLNTADTRRSWAVKIKFVKKFANPLHLEAFKAEPTMQTFPLVRIGRLSVMPVSAAEASWILQRVD